MNYRSLLKGWSAVLAVVAAVAFPTKAETITGYTESFSGLDTEYAKFAPRGWTHYIGYEWYANKFESHATGGRTSGWLEAKKPSSTYYLDGFITPKVGGDVVIYVKKTSEDGTVEFYTSSDGATLGNSYSATKYSGTVEGKDRINTDSWTQVKLPSVPPGTCLGIVPVNAGICDFSAATADVEYVNRLELSISKISTEALRADSENKVTIPVKAKFVNAGDFDVAANTPGFSVSVRNTHTDRDFSELPVTVAIPRGKTVEVDLEFTGDATLAPNTTSNSFKFTESLTGASESLYFTIIPFAPVYNFVMAENGTHSIENLISFGMTAAAAERLFFVHNSGTDVLKVSDIQVAGDFELASPSEGEIQPGGNMAVNVRFKASEDGYHVGSLTIVADRIGSHEYVLEGLRRNMDRYFESFEGAEKPAGYIYDSNWKLASDNADFKSEGNGQWIAQSYSSPQAMTMPLMRFADGEGLAFFANKSDNTSANLEVQVSEDRMNWTSVYKVGASPSVQGVDAFFTNEPPSETGTGYGKYAFRLFNVPMPPGTCYVRFVAGGVRIHDIYGGENVPVEHDVLYKGHAAPSAGMVNNRYNAVVTLFNVSAEDESGYGVSLYVDGEKTASAQETGLFTSGADKAFAVGYTPHSAGEKTAFFRFENGGFIYDTPEFVFDVREEVAVKTVQVGEPLISSNGPVNTSYKNSASQVIYAADRLGIAANSRITGMHYRSYMSQPVSGNLKVWVQNTEDAGYDAAFEAADPDDMTLVFDGRYEQDRVGEASQPDKMDDCWEVQFSQDFLYTGKNLRVMVQFENSTAETVGSFFAFDNSTRPDDDKFISFSTSRDLDDLDLEWRWSRNTYGIPVAYFEVEKETAAVNGRIADSETDAPVAGATVTFVSGEVMYSAVSDDAGRYEMVVFQPDMEYSADVRAEDYLTHSGGGHTFVAGAAPNVKDFVLVKDPLTGIDDIALSGDETVSVYDINGILRMENATRADLCRLPDGAYVAVSSRGSFRIIK